LSLADELGLSVLLMRPLGEGRLTENAAGGVAASAGTGTLRRAESSITIELS
jgi:hypothetical protein